MSDVERWLKSCVTEVDGADAILKKELLCESFFAFISADAEVGKDHFFSLLGNALLRVGYNKVKPIRQKGRRVAYRGVAFQNKEAITACTLQQWMNDNYCEGSQSDVVLGEDLWLHFRDKCEIREDGRSLFFSLLGNTVFKQSPFLKVRRQTKRNAQGRKKAIFHFLRVKKIAPKNENVHELLDVDSCKRDNPDFVDDKNSDNENFTLTVENNEGFVPSQEKEEKAKSTSEEDEFATKEAEDDEKEETQYGVDGYKEEIAPKDENVHELLDVDSCKRDNQDFVDDKDSDNENFTLTAENNEGFVSSQEKEEKAKSTSEEDEFATKEAQDDEKEETQYGEDGYKEELQSSFPTDEIYPDSVGSDSDMTESEMDENAETSGHQSCKNKEEKLSPTDDIFHKYHKIIDLLPRHLPGNPKSFQSFLQSVFPDLSNVSVERHNIHSSSAGTTVYKDAQIRAFVAACFPPIKVGSFAGECNSFTFEGDVLPQFTQIEKGSFSCEICIPFCKWAIINNHPYPSARSKHATVDAILAGTAKLVFSGMVQVREHSMSKCHVEATKFWRKEKVQSKKVRPPMCKGEEIKKKSIADFFKKATDHLNWQRLQSLNKDHNNKQ